MYRAVLVLVLALLAAQETLSTETLAFTASCTAVRVEASRYDRDMQGNLMQNGWFAGERERFRETWVFEYAGGHQIKIDGKPIPILAEAGPVLVAGEPGETSEAGIRAAGIWVYVIHRDLKVISASQVNGYSGAAKDAGIKSRSVELRCEFESA